jgi:type II secretory pathway pseudopilin PulG
MGLAGQYRAGDHRGYAMAALLVGMSVMAVMMAAALPVWSHMVQREKEAELVWRGEQYKRAITLFQRKYANAFPPTIDLLVEQKFLRKKYKDPIANDDFQIIPVGAAVPGSQALPGMPGQSGTAGQMGAPGSAGSGFGPSVNQAGGFGSGQPPGGGFGGGPGSGGGFGNSQRPGGVGAGPGGGVGTMQPGQTAAGGRGIQGVTSKSKDQSIRLYNGMDRYNQWAFIAMATSAQAGQGAMGFGRPGQMAPPPGGGFGQPGGGFGQPGGVPQPGGFPQPGGMGGQNPFQQGPLGGRPGVPTPGGPGTVFTPVNPGGTAPSRPPVGGGGIFRPSGS